MLIGTNINPEVLITRNIIMEFVAVSFFGFKSCSSFIAFNPKGVAALSSPSILAAIFIKIEPITGCPFGISGNKRHNTGLNHLDKAAIKPLLSPIFMMPSQSESTPVSPKDTSNAVFEELKVELIISVKICVSPKKNSLIRAIIKAIIKKAIQM